MKSKGYSEQHNKTKKIILAMIVLLFTILIFMLILVFSLNNVKENSEITYDNLTTIKQVIEYYQSTYKSEEKSSTEGFYIDVYAKIKCMPYEEDDKSNEEYYTKLLTDCAKMINYKNFIIIDKDNDLIIKVKCRNNEVIDITINDIEDYFTYMDSQISMKKYKKIEEVELQVSSNILNECINNSWDGKINFGSRESIFEEYYIYFEEGLKVRVIDNLVYNIIFTKNYKENVISNLFPGVDLEIVKATLGKPSFEDEENNIVGYKGERLYAFFTNDEISIYRNSSISADDFLKLSDGLQDESMDILDFMNELTYLWPDYSIYDYKSNYVYISYPLKGIEIKLNYDDTNGILVYNNIKSSLSKVGRYLENTNFISRLQVDLVFQTEKERIEKKNNYKDLCLEYSNSLDKEIQEIIGESLNYMILPTKDDNGIIYLIKFISKFGTEPDRELSDTVNSYLWGDSNTFIYSKKGKGIYIYNLLSGRISRIVEGNYEFEIKGYTDGILKYDNSEIEIAL